MKTGRESLREQLAEVRRSKFANIPRVRPVMQMFLPSASKSEVGRVHAQKTVLDWASEKWPGLIPAAAFAGEDFEHERPGLKLASVGLPDQDVWGFFVEHLDMNATYSRTWVTEALVAEVNGTNLLAVRNQCSSTSMEDVPATTPRFVRQWIERQELIDGGSPILGSEIEISNDEDFRSFAKFLLNGDSRGSARLRQ